MRIERSTRRSTGARIATTSMADIVFLLIVFFVLTYQVQPDPTRVILPETIQRNEVPRDAALISVAAPDRNHVIRVSSGKEMSLAVRSDEEVLSFAANVVAAEPERVFVIKADRGVGYERVDTVLEALKQVRAKTIYLLSEQKTKG
jgi:biopolymer transport protein ExbD